MPSILPNYEYDIFISYRQNDNKRDGWVTNFVAALKDELEATLKNPVSIYFDENPHDGLLETHQVNASLEKKLKCLVFIPIISQTYCDTKSFAWEHEFLPFLEMAKKDELGMNITLANGNVVSRVLPVKIHDIDDQDKRVVETELAGPLRCIDFTYKEPGVNRPLKTADTKGDILYHNQINKVANALKEIGSALLVAGKPPLPTSAKVEQNTPTPSPADKKSSIKKVLFAVAASLILLLAYFLYPTSPKISGAHEYDIAVMYLENLTDDPKYGEGLVNLIQINLSEDTSINLVPRQKLYDELREINNASKAPDQSVATELASEIDAEFMIIGRVIQQKLEVLAQVELIEVVTGKVVATKKVQGAKEEIFQLADNITRQLMQGRLPERNYNVTSLTTGNYDAYQLFYDGLEHLWDLEGPEASAKFEAAIQLDSTFALAYMYNAFAVNPSGNQDIYHDKSESNSYLDQAYRMSSTLPAREQLMVQMIYEHSTQNPKYLSTLTKLLEADPDNRLAVAMAAITTYWQGVENEDNIKIVEAYLVRNPNDHGMWNSLAYLYKSNGQDNKASMAVATYLELRPDLWNAYHSSWEINVMIGRLNVAKRFANQIDDKFPENRSRGTWIGFTNLIEKRPNECLASFNSFRDKTFYRGLQNLGPAAYLMKGEITKAARTNDEVVSRYVENDFLSRSREIRLNKALIYMTGGRFSQAEKLLNNLIKEVANESEYNPFTFFAYYYKGLVYIAKGDISSANAQLNLLVELLTSNKNDQRFSVYERLLAAEIALKRDDLQSVDSVLLPILVFYKNNNPRYYYLHLKYLIATGRFEEAIEYIDNIHRYLLSGRAGYGGNKLLYTINLMFGDYYKGIIYEKQNRPREALVAYGAFLELIKDSDPGIKEKEDAQRRVKALIKRVSTAL